MICNYDLEINLDTNFNEIENFGIFMTTLGFYN